MKSFLTQLDAERLASLIGDFGQACLDHGEASGSDEEETTEAKMKIAHKTMCDFLTELQS